jgi:hypothetical protein
LLYVLISFTFIVKINNLYIYIYLI